MERASKPKGAREQLSGNEKPHTTQSTTRIKSTQTGTVRQVKRWTVYLTAGNLHTPSTPLPWQSRSQSISSHTRSRAARTSASPGVVCSGRKHASLGAGGQSPGWHGCKSYTQKVTYEKRVRGGVRVENAFVKDCSQKNRVGDGVRFKT
jgi:hypothetical protein